MRKINVKGDIIPNDYKWIYDWLGYEGTCPNDVISELELAAGDQVVIWVNSPGGYITAGSEIYTAISCYEGNKTIQLAGMAASAASVIACAAYCEISPTAMMMVHNVSGQVAGDYRVMEKESETLKVCNKTIANAYMRKTGMSMEEALSLMNDETWIDADRAVELKLADKIMFQDGPIRDFSGMTNMLQGYTNSVSQLSIPEDMIAKLMDNQQRYADVSRNKAKVQAELELLKLGGKMYE